MSRDLSIPKCMRRWWIQWNKVYWSPKQYHFSRCTYPGSFLWITLRRSFIPWRRLTFSVVIQTENNIDNLKILLPSISQHLNNFFWTICHQNQLSSAITCYYVVLIFESVYEILWCDHSNKTSSISSTFTWYRFSLECNQACWMKCTS